MSTFLRMKKRETKGFTLVETMIAITILATAIVGPFQVAQGVLASSYTARDQLIASSLAQEGIEYVRYLRDSNFLNTLHGGSTTWLAGLDGSSGSPNCYYQSSTKSCTIDPSTQTVAQCTGLTCAEAPLYLNSANRYTQSATGNTQTRFTRKVQLVSVNGHETQVIVTVSWTGHGSYSVVLVDNLENWL